MSRGSRVGTRPGDRPSAQRSNNRPLMWNCGRQWRTARVTLAVLRFFGVIVSTITRGLNTPPVPTACVIELRRCLTAARASGDGFR